MLNAGFLVFGYVKDTVQTTELRCTEHGQRFAVGFEHQRDDGYYLRHHRQQRRQRYAVQRDGDGFGWHAHGHDTFNWTVTNQAVTVTNPGTQNNAEGDNVSLQVSASDPSGNALSFTATGLPAGLQFDYASGHDFRHD